MDEFGYVQLDARGSELLFQGILAEREERSSVALASNLPFSEWGGVVPDPRLVAAIVDRVTFNAHIIETGTGSYRLRTTKGRSGRQGNPGPKDHTGLNRAEATRSAPLRNIVDLRHDNRECHTGLTHTPLWDWVDFRHSPSRDGVGYVPQPSWPPPHRAPGGPGRYVIVAGGLSETAAQHLAESINEFFNDILGRPATSTACRQCATAISWPGSGRPPLYCSPACRQQAYRDRQR